MILKYGFSNFLSFNKYVEFSMLAAKSKVKNRFPDNYVSLRNGLDVNKVAVIVGENAGGKTNFVKSLEYFKGFFSASELINSSTYLIHVNNRPNKCPKECDTTQKYYLVVSDNEGSIFTYDLEIDIYGIVKENLKYKYKGGKTQKILEVDRLMCNSKCNSSECNISNCKISGSVEYRIDFGDKKMPKNSEETLEKMSTHDMPIGLFVTREALLGSKLAVRFISIVSNDIFTDTNLINYDLFKAMNKEKRDVEILLDERYFSIFRIVDYSIIGIKVNEEDPFLKTKLIRRRKDGTVFEREIAADSSGVREFFAWAIQLFRVIYENKTVIADEMDRVLNPVLSDRIVSLINGTDHSGQFIFTSHNVLHLDLRNYMKEQIYFITKDNETLESDLYSLSDFPEVRYETTKVYEFYLKGILGGTSCE